MNGVPENEQYVVWPFSQESVLKISSGTALALVALVFHFILLKV